MPTTETAIGRAPLNAVEAGLLMSGDTIWEIDGGAALNFRRFEYGNIYVTQMVQGAYGMRVGNERRLTPGQVTAYSEDGMMTMPLVRMFETDRRAVWLAGVEHRLIRHLSGAYVRISDRDQAIAYSRLSWHAPTQRAAVAGVTITATPATPTAPQVATPRAKAVDTASAPAVDLSNMIDKRLVAVKMRKLAEEHSWCEVARQGLTDLGIDWPEDTVDVVVSMRLTVSKEGMNAARLSARVGSAVTVGADGSIVLAEGWNIVAPPSAVRVSTRN